MDEKNRRAYRNPSPPPGYIPPSNPQIVLKPEVEQLLNYFPFLEDDISNNKCSAVTNAGTLERMKLVIESGLLEDSSDDDFSLIVDGEELGIPPNKPKSPLLSPLIKSMKEFLKEDNDDAKQQDGDSKSSADPDVSTYTSELAPDITTDHKGEKRQLDKCDPDSPKGNETKIVKLETSQLTTCYPPLGIPDIPKLEQYISKRNKDSANSDEKDDAGDIVMEMSLACVICKQIEINQKNQLIECQECHGLYHQKCHQSAASDYDLNDPRRTWYCAKCMKNMK